MQWKGCFADEWSCVAYLVRYFLIITAVGDDTVELKFQFNFEFCIRRKQIINYSRIHVSLCELLYFCLSKCDSFHICKLT
jgi:hypothetical protein